MQRGDPPGTVSVIEPELLQSAPTAPEELLVSPHEMDPQKVLLLASLLGGRCGHVVLVGCEAANLGDAEFGGEGLSPAVAAAVAHAAETVETIAHQLVEQEAV